MARQEALAQAEAEREQQEREYEMAQIRNQLESLIDNPAKNFDELRDKERELLDIKYQNIDDPEIQSLIKKAEYALQLERENLENKQDYEEQGQSNVDMNLKNQLEDYFQSIATAGSSSLANIRIERTLELFSSEDVPVLIVISEVRGRRDYDRPTTIKRYLNYLKDQEKPAAYVDRVVMDANGRIKELELIHN